MALLAAHFLAVMNLDYALLVVTCFYCYLRPGEVRSIKVREFLKPVVSHVAPRGTGAFHALMIAPWEDCQPSKTQTFDETIVLDYPPSLGPCLERLASRRGPDEKLFNVCPRVLNNMWSEAVASLGLLDLVMYQLRHGGASRDARLRSRSWAEIQARGRWMSQSSLRRYTKAGQVSKLLLRLAPRHVHQADVALKKLEDILKLKSLPVRIAV